MTKSVDKSAVLGLAITTAALRVAQENHDVQMLTDVTTFDPEYVEDIINSANGYMEWVGFNGEVATRDDIFATLFGIETEEDWASDYAKGEI